MLKNNSYMKAYLNTIKEDINVEKCQQIAKIIGGEYDVETNTIDCKGHDVRFHNDWLNKKGSFDFKLTNTSSYWTNMFNSCYDLKYLPKDFTIPNHVTNIDGAFSHTNLLYLPNNFTIPNNIESCSCTFSCCAWLTRLPESFRISENTKTCSFMFCNCRALKYIPEGFTIPDGVEFCMSMFENCMSLPSLPKSFHIPANSSCRNIFEGCDNLTFHNPERYMMWEI